MITRKQLVLAIIVIVFAIACVIASTSAAPQYPQKLQRYVTDDARIFTPEQERVIDLQCRMIEEATKRAVTVLVITTDTGGMDSNTYIENLRRQSTSGAINLDSSTILVIPANKQSGWILSPGKTTPQITDAQVSQILSRSKPMQDQGNYSAAVDSVLSDVRSIYTDPNATFLYTAPSTQGVSNFTVSPILVYGGIAALVGIGLLAIYLYRRK